MLTMQQIIEAEKARQLRYSIGVAKVREVTSFQDEESGKPISYAKVEMGASVVTILGEPAELAKLEPLKGKYCSIEGNLETELKKTGLKVRFTVEKAVEIK